MATSLISIECIVYQDVVSYAIQHNSIISKGKMQHKNGLRSYPVLVYNN